MRKGILYSAVLGAMFISGQASAIEFDGFLTAGFAVHDQEDAAENDISYIGGVTNDISFDTDSKFGLQMTADVFNNMQAVAQILATGEDQNYDMDVEWAYLDYTISNSFSLRGGKVKEPVFLISDYFEVSYAYPWIRPPEEVYGANPINTIVGMQALFTVGLGSSNIIFQPYLGSNTDDVPGTGGAVTFNAERFYGGALQWSSAAFTFQMSTLKTDVSTQGYLPVAGGWVLDGACTPGVDCTVIITPTPGTSTSPPVPGAVPFLNATSTGEAQLSSVGFSFDIRNFIGYAEFVTRDISGDVEGLFPDQDGYYVTFGYRAGKYLPHITVASVESDPLPAAFGASQGSTQDSVTLGLRYELNDSASLKFEYQMISLDDTLMTTNPAQPGNNGFFNSQSIMTDDKANMISMAIDVIF